MFHPFLIRECPDLRLGSDFWEKHAGGVSDLLWHLTKGFPGGSDGKESACNVGDLGSIPGLGRSPGEGNGNPLHYSCLENSMDRGAWWATAHGGLKESDATEQLPLSISL